LGGGSLVIAYPMLLALRVRPSTRTLRMIATPATAAYAEALGVFDEIVVIHDDDPARLLADSIRAIRKFWRTDALIDLEIHSRLTTVFCLLTCARNRVGFFTEISFWRRDLSTHLLFCHVGNGIFHFYDQIAALFGAPVPTMRAASEGLRKNLELVPLSSRVPGARRVVGLAPCCSGLGRERMLEPSEWVSILSAEHDREPIDELILFGGPSDVEDCGGLATALRASRPNLHLRDTSGSLPLREAVRLLGTVDALFAIDSGLLHFARLMGVPTTSYWGPTAPATRLRPSDIATDQVRYASLPCSPCVHVVATPPCRGNNLCMRFAVDPGFVGDRNPPWIVQASGQSPIASDILAPNPEVSRLKTRPKGKTRPSM